MEFRAEIKRTLTGPDKLRAVCSVILDDCFLVKNVRVVGAFFPGGSNLKRSSNMRPPKAKDQP